MKKTTNKKVENTTQSNEARNKNLVYLMDWYFN